MFVQLHAVGVAVVAVGKLPKRLATAAAGVEQIRRHALRELDTAQNVRDIFNIILDEWQLTKDVILEIEGHDELLAENTYLRDSLHYRMPYFNVLNYIQLELIKRQRNGQLTPDQEKLIHITINGIATGLRNSG